MKPSLRRITFRAFLFLIGLHDCRAATQPSQDVLIYGGSSAAVIAAVQAKRMGHTVTIVCPDTHLGGLTSGGLGWTDSGRKEAIGGLTRQFYQRIYQHYQQDSAWKWQSRESYGNRGQGTPAIDAGGRAMWVFEPHVAEQIFESLIRENQIPVHRNQWLDRSNGVTKEGNRIVSIRTLDGKVWPASMFIDATYEGDLMAAAKVRYTIGREANTTYGETLNGVQSQRATKHQFTLPISARVDPANPQSPLLPRVSPPPPETDGQRDSRIQAYCYRTCLTNHPENRIPFPKPDDYDAQQYELLLRYLQAGWKDVFGKFDPIPNRKTDTNNHGAFSFDNIGRNYDYPEATYERRREILHEHTTYQQGLLWFLSHDPRVPEDVRLRMSQWGLARDEFPDTQHWPHQLYIREARRMVSDFVITEAHLKLEKPTPRPIGMGSYNMDSHHVQRYADANGFARNEGDIQVALKHPYPIDLGAILPPPQQCSNLLVPVCLSSSHIAYGSIRMEPVFMILGQSAATAACLALTHRVPVQEMDFVILQEQLLKDGQVLSLPP